MIKENKSLKLIRKVIHGSRVSVIKKLMSDTIDISSLQSDYIKSMIIEYVTYVNDNVIVKLAFYNHKSDKVAEFKIWKWWDGINISNLEINEEYRDKGLFYELLDYAIKKLGVKNLTVEKGNKIVKYVHDKYGFEIIDEDYDLYYMSLKNK